MTTKAIYPVLLAAMLCAAPAALAQQVYQWTDENGVVHYTDQPPDRADAEVTEVKPLPEVGTESPTAADPAAAESDDAGEETLSPAEQARRERAEAREERRALEAEIAADCLRAKQTIAQLEPSPRVIYTDEEGNTRRMDDDRRLELLEEARSFVERNDCE
ncbi:MAG: DUF4124 domain-containing protein [Xanthomonadales bacterium]|nr:DUF4124 domain-containing protein [Xanthomonadales bacterium]